MKLSEMSTDRLADVMVKIAEPVERIGGDEELGRKLEEIAKRGGRKGLQNIVDMYCVFVPLLLERHREDTYAVLAALTGKTAEQIAAQSAMDTMRDARESVDAEFLRFFGWSGSMDAGT